MTQSSHASSVVTRTALSEIPIVMGRLSVSSEDLPLHHPIIVDVNDVSSEYFSPTSSPDEYVIRQRGNFNFGFNYIRKFFIQYCECIFIHKKKTMNIN